MGGAILLGLFLGMRHALDADHLAAVATLSSGSRSIKDAIKLGLAWGLGHTFTLCAFGLFVLSLDSVIPESLALWLEFIVGLMLVWLGADLLVRFRKSRIHFHTHHHADGTIHFHAHSHKYRAVDSALIHDHIHLKRAPLRAFIVGLMHGMAGSAALLMLSVERFDNFWSGLGYIALFGCGAMIGMAVLSVAIAIPLRKTISRVSWAYNAIIYSLAGVSIAIGVWVLYDTLLVKNIFSA